MLNTRSGFPDEGDCVFCTVTKVHYNSVFVTLDEYDRKSGMIHISEVSPGRIRNINDYVKEGKVIICKVLKVKKDRGHIDLSLRRVNENQRRAKIEERKQQAIAENIIKSYAQLQKKDLKKVYAVLAKVLLDKYDSVYKAFEAVVEDDISLADQGVDKDLASELEVIIRERIKPKQVSIDGLFVIENYDENGVEIINAFMEKAEKLSEFLTIRFLGAGRFKIMVVAPDYELAEQAVSSFTELMDASLKKTASVYSFERD